MWRAGLSDKTHTLPEEEQIITSVLKEESHRDAVFTSLRGEHFLDPRLGVIFEKLRQAWRDGYEFDRFKLRSLLLQPETPEPEVLCRIFDNLWIEPAYFSSLDSQIEVTKDRWRLQKLLDAAGKLIRNAHDLCYSEATELLHKELARVAKTQAVKHRPIPEIAKDWKGSGLSVDEYYDLRAQEAHNGKLRGPEVSTGFKSLDAAIGGFVPGRLIVFGARTSTGKSEWASHFARVVADQGFNFLYWSAEMNAEELMLRWICQYSGIPQYRLDDTEGNHISRLTPLDFEKIQKATERLETAYANSSVLYAPGMSHTDLKAQVMRAKQQSDCRLVIVDHLGRLNAENKKLSTYDRTSEISWSLKQIAAECDVCVLALAQLNREAARKEIPSLIELRDSGKIEEDADQVILMHRNDTGKVSLIVAKNRHGGRMGRLDFSFNPEKPGFYEAPIQETSTPNPFEDYE